MLGNRAVPQDDKLVDPLDLREPKSGLHRAHLILVADLAVQEVDVSGRAAVIAITSSALMIFVARSLLMA